MLCNEKLCYFYAQSTVYIYIQSIQNTQFKNGRIALQWWTIARLCIKVELKTWLNIPKHKTNKYLEGIK